MTRRERVKIRMPGDEACKGYDVPANGEAHHVKAISPLATCPAEVARSCS